MQVIFDWSKAPEANPSTMSLYLFPKNGGQPQRYEFVDRNGSEIRVAAGSYDALCLNSDTEGIEYRNTDAFETFEAYTRNTELLQAGLTSLGVSSSGAPRPTVAEDERIALAADTLWTGSLLDIRIADSDDTQSITLTPDISVCNYRVEITGAENLKYTLGLSAALTGMSGGVKPSDGSISDEVVTHPFTMYMADDQTSLSGSLLTFGHCPAADATHTLTVYAVLGDGQKFAYTYDSEEVTRQIHEAPDQRNVVIRLEGLPLPKPIANGGGFQPSVGDWGEVNVEIPM